MSSFKFSEACNSSRQESSVRTTKTTSTSTTSFSTAYRSTTSSSSFATAPAAHASGSGSLGASSDQAAAAPPAHGSSSHVERHSSVSLSSSTSRTQQVHGTSSVRLSSARGESTDGLDGHHEHGHQHVTEVRRVDEAGSNMGGGGSHQAEHLLAARDAPVPARAPAVALAREVLPLRAVVVGNFRYGARNRLETFINLTERGAWWLPSLHLI